MNSMRKSAPIAGAVVMSFLVVACGGGDDADSSVAGSSDDATGLELGDDDDLDGDLDDDLDEAADALGQAMGAGGGGMLVFDGEEYPIESAVCSLESDRVEAGTVGSDYRVLVSGDPADLDLQILGPDTLWFDGGRTADGPPSGLATIDGNTITADENVWWNNDDEREVMASFVIECP